MKNSDYLSDTQDSQGPQCKQGVEDWVFTLLASSFSRLWLKHCYPVSPFQTNGTIITFIRDISMVITQAVSSGCKNCKTNLDEQNSATNLINKRLILVPWR